ncbi:hypothetical protein EWM64_g10354 [Hericium alpestre]|uniref:DUF1618 domain-containing protein n=1 Tax=Hericium alpestre TaxID=135208 RepID=A0A4Y9ZJ13_9AGAM|nr:hypothetical protein EWM64_g10354 [Hericium alpestre]
MKLYCSPLDLEFSVVAATVDPARDLLALVELHPPDDPDADEGLWVRIHLIRIFQGCPHWTPHPDAHDPAEQIDFYECTSPFRYYSEVFTLRIAGTRLMLNVGDGIAFSSLYLWDWTTGPLIFERTPEEIWSMQDDLPDSLQLNTDLEGNEPGQWCFGDMLSPDAFITAQYIQTYTSDEQPHREEVFCGIDVFRIGQEARHPSVLHLITLMLPVPVRDFTIKPNIVAGSCSPQPDPRTPFSCDPSSRIIVIDLGDLESPIAPCIVVPQSILIALAEKYDAEDERMKIPWEEWGPQNTRVIETARSGHCLRAFR